MKARCLNSVPLLLLLLFAACGKAQRRSSPDPVSAVTAQQEPVAATDKLPESSRLMDYSSPVVLDDIKLGGLTWTVISVKLEHHTIYVEIFEGCWVALGKWAKRVAEVIHAAD